MLYIKMMGKLIGTHHVVKFVCKRHRRFSLGALGLPRGPWEAFKLQINTFLRIVGIYIKLIPLMGKLILTHLIMRLVCQGPPKDLRGAVGPCKVPWGTHKFQVCYISKLITMIGKLFPIETHHVMRFLCQGHKESGVTLTYKSHDMMCSHEFPYHWDQF